MLIVLIRTTICSKYPENGHLICYCFLMIFGLSASVAFSAGGFLSARSSDTSRQHNSHFKLKNGQPARITSLTHLTSCLRWKRQRLSESLFICHWTSCVVAISFSIKWSSSNEDSSWLERKLFCVHKLSILRPQDTRLSYMLINFKLKFFNLKRFKFFLFVWRFGHLVESLFWVKCFDLKLFFWQFLIFFQLYFIC